MAGTYLLIILAAVPLTFLIDWAFWQQSMLSASYLCDAEYWTAPKGEWLKSPGRSRLVPLYVGLIGVLTAGVLPNNKVVVGGIGLVLVIAYGLQALIIMLRKVRQHHADRQS